jgi:hypothetical protein
VAGSVNGRNTLLVSGPIQMALMDVPHTVASMVFITVAMKESLMSAMEFEIKPGISNIHPFTAACQLD